MEKHSKVYGLSFPTRKPKDNTVHLVESVFACESDDESDKPQLKPLNVSATSAISQARMHHKTKTDLEKAVAEDPSVFQYDEIYDDICNKKSTKLDTLFPGKPRESRYVEKLLKTAGERKLERDLCSERKAHKEIEEERHLYGDKEAFVTSAYKEKLNELDKLVSKREEEEVREKLMDITSQEGLGGFYRYMYQHEMDRTTSADANTKVSTLANTEAVLDKNSPPVESVNNERLFKSNTALSDHKTRKPPKDSKGCEESGCILGDHPSRNSRSVDKNELSRNVKEHTVPTKSPDSSTSIKSNSVHKRAPVNTSRTSNYSSAAYSNPKPQFNQARPRVTTGEQVRDARKRYLARKVAGICPPLASSDSEEFE